MSKFLTLVFICGIHLCSVLSKEVVHKDGYCVMFDVVPGTKHNYEYNKKAKNITGESYKILKETCPYLARNGPTNTHGCCSLAQLRNLQNQLQTAATLFSRCPSCSRNFYDMWCQFTCSPDQSTFLEYTIGFITSSEFYVSTEFAAGLYNSCKDVIFPGSNGKVLDYMCGTTAAKCNKEKFLKFIGTTPNAPFTINFHINDTKIPTNMTETNLKMIGCNETYFDTNVGRNTSTCSCQDCHLTCPVPPSPPTPPKPVYIMGIKLYYFIVGICTVLWLSLFLVYSVLDILRSSKQAVIDIHARADPLRAASLHSTPETHNLTDALYDVDDKKGFLVRLGVRAEDTLQSLFRRWGTMCARHPFIVISATLLVILVCSLGLLKFTVITNPIDLWSSKDSEARHNKMYYDEKFTPFYRTEQVIITTTEELLVDEYQIYQQNIKNFSGIIHLPILKEVLKLQLSLMNITVEHKNETVHLEDICLQPLSPDNTACTVFSALQYWQNNITNLDKCIDEMERPCDGTWNPVEDWHDQLLGCAKNPSSVSNGNYLHLPCMSTFGAPVSPKLVFGGFNGTDYAQSKSLILTFVVKNHKNEEDNKKAETWEKAFIAYLKNYAKSEAPKFNLSIAFSSERSIQDEISRASEGDVLTILLSYILMFLYIAIGLGQYKTLVRILVDAKITVGIVGVIIVLFSVSSSLGVFSYAGVSATLIIIEVIPFLVLAVGVDNIFILVQALQRDIRLPGKSIEEQVGRVLGTVGPSMLLSSLSESVAFGFGALSTMPAVHTFSQYAALAVAINFALQVTLLIAAVTLDAKRQSNNKLDVACCIGIDKSNQASEDFCAGGILHYLVKNVYSPFLMLYPVRIVVVMFFSIYLACSICFIPNIDIGLSQTIALPSDSYLMNYFGNLTKYLKTGAPVYFVVKDSYDYSERKCQNGVCGTSGCKTDSLVGSIFSNSLISNYSTIALPASSWIDDYFSWIDPKVPCCRILNYTTSDVVVSNKTVEEKTFSKTLKFCPSSSPKSWNCYPCLPASQAEQRPTPLEFRTFLAWYLKDNPNKICAKGGHPAYGGAVKLNAKSDPNYNKYLVNSSYFMTYHTVLTTSKDFTDALKHAKEMAKNMTKTIGHEVFPYSVFYVFYEQYLTIVQDTWKDILISLAAIFVVTFLLMGFNFGLAFCICLTVSMIVVNLMGLMYLWNISLNAVALVNLVMATGISVEFCSHIARAFSTSPYTSRVKRAEDALGRVGGSVLSGITFTKFVGVFVLMFAKSRLFEVYYFRMYMGIIIIGATHGLIFLPVLLSYIGPASRATEEDIRRASQSRMKVASIHHDSMLT